MSDRVYVEAWQTYSAVTFALLGLGLPAYIMWRPARTGERIMGKRFFFSVIGTSLAPCIHRIFVGEKIQRLYVVASVNGVFGADVYSTNDGQAGTALVFLLGILISAASSGLAWALLAARLRLRLRRIANDALQRIINRRRSPF